MVMIIKLVKEDYEKFFRELFWQIGEKGDCIIDLAYGEGLTQADICGSKSPKLFFKKLEIEINMDFKGVFDSERIEGVIYNLIIEQSHDEYFILEPKLKNKENWKKLLKAIENLILPSSKRA